MIDYKFVGTEQAGEIVAVENGRRVGRLTFEVVSDACLINYLFVMPSVRRRGIATMLMLELYDRIFDSDIAEISLLSPREEASLEAFLQKMYFSKEDSFGDFLSLSVRELLDKTELRDAKAAEMFLPLKEVRAPGMIKALGDILERSGYEDDAKMLFSECDTACSGLLLSAGRAVGVAALKKISENEMIISHIYVEPEEKERLTEFLKSVVLAVRDNVSDECEVSVFVSTDEERSFAKRIFRDAHMGVKTIIRYFVEMTDEEGR
ncbi:MAG: GNAT family N-acetyltransferase [Lachnospiraceae bacterium]|nr:GNAT family N-acetyltransferase [Lachnospiraceae bacterium]